jgi:uncharacterized iron-regulated membrane protein
VRATLIKVHRYVSLTLLSLWIVQALTGVLNVYHRELGDAALGVQDEAVDIDALGAGIERLEATRPRVSSVYAGGGAAGQFDVFVRDEAGATRVVRLDAHGKFLRERPWAANLGEAGLLQTSRIIHETLFAGDYGHTLVGLSGLVLLTNIVLALKLAWPRRGTWRRALRPVTTGAAPTVTCSWHRALGLAFALPAILFVTAGILTAFVDPLEATFGPVAPEPVLAEGATSALERIVSPARAMHIALERYPGAPLSIVNLPDAGTAWYRVRLLQPGEPRRVFGTTTVFVNKATGAILADYDALAEPVRIRVLNAFYALHTGEWLGAVGRVLSLLTGVWLTGMIALGTTLWWLRRRSRRTASSLREAAAAGESARGCGDAG